MKEDYSGDKYVYCGAGFLDLLCITFIILKLCHVINWSWWIVLLPFWGPIAATTAIVVIVIIVSLLVGLANKDK